MREVFLEDLRAVPVSEQKFELVERKGLGHPDYITDSIMDAVSVALSQEYIKRFGRVMHHNIDKGFLVAGESNVKFGGGRVIKPMLIIFGDRATWDVDGEYVPVDKIAIQSAKQWLRENLRFVDPDRILYQIEIKRGSSSLTDIFKRGEKVLGANDTSAAVGYAPFTDTEKIVFKLENYLNSKDFKRKFPESGEDVKVMGLRIKDKVDITVAMSFVDRFIESESDYFRKKDVIMEKMNQFLKENLDMKFTLNFNSLDRKGRGVDGCYLTVTGTSADSGDSGQVGRGNRVNGIIPLNRPVSSEAAAGKNPVSHIGKIYNILSHKLAKEIYNNVPDIKEVYVWLLSKIGQPIDNPANVTVQLIMERGNARDVKKEIEETVNKEFDNITKFCNDLASGKMKIC